MKGEPSKSELQEQVKTLQRRVADQEVEIKLLRQKIDALSRKIFGKSSEQLNAAQLELLFQLEKLPPGKSEVSLDLEETEGTNAKSSFASKAKGSSRKDRLPSDLPVVEEIVDPLEVTQEPESWRCIGQEVSERLDYEPARFLCRRLVRRKYVRKAQVDAVPVIAPLPPMLQERCQAAPGLLAFIAVSKYCDHLPLYRLESIFQSRHGIHLPRQTLARWMHLVADWLQPIYELIRSGVMGGGYVQIDETPIRYLAPGHGTTKLGYLWTSCAPTGDIFYRWETGRGSDCLKKIIPIVFRGTVQADGYSAYAKYVRESEGRICLAGCWAHARRKFHDAREQAPQVAGFILRQIQLLYRVEKELREASAGASLRKVRRLTESLMIHCRIGKILRTLKQGRRYLPSSLMGKAINYALNNWTELTVYLTDGRVEIDNNLVENAIRPTALGKKNWLFIGDAEAGQTAAIIYTIVENCRRQLIDPYSYLLEVLTRLPSMTNWQVNTLLPSVWNKNRQSQQSAQAA